jgi:hypothetical protein
MVRSRADRTVAVLVVTARHRYPPWPNAPILGQHGSLADLGRSRTPSSLVEIRARPLRILEPGMELSQEVQVDFAGAPRQDFIFRWVLSIRIPNEIWSLRDRSYRPKHMQFHARPADRMFAMLPRVRRDGPSNVRDISESIFIPCHPSHLTQHAYAFGLRLYASADDMQPVLTEYFFPGRTPSKSIAGAVDNHAFHDRLHGCIHHRLIQGKRVGSAFPLHRHSCEVEDDLSGSFDILVRDHRSHPRVAWSKV